MLDPGGAADDGDESLSDTEDTDSDTDSSHGHSKEDPPYVKFFKDVCLRTKKLMSEKWLKKLKEAQIFPTTFTFPPLEVVNTPIEVCLLSLSQALFVATRHLRAGHAITIDLLQSLVEQSAPSGDLRGATVSMLPIYANAIQAFCDKFKLNVVVHPLESRKKDVSFAPKLGPLDYHVLRELQTIDLVMMCISDFRVFVAALPCRSFDEPRDVVVKCFDVFKKRRSLWEKLRAQTVDEDGFAKLADEMLSLDCEVNDGPLVAMVGQARAGKTTTCAALFGKTDLLRGNGQTTAPIEYCSLSRPDWQAVVTFREDSHKLITDMQRAPLDDEYSKILLAALKIPPGVQPADYVFPGVNATVDNLTTQSVTAANPAEIRRKHALFTSKSESSVWPLVDYVQVSGDTALTGLGIRVLDTCGVDDNCLMQEMFTRSLNRLDDKTHIVVFVDATKIESTTSVRSVLRNNHIAQRRISDQDGMPTWFTVVVTHCDNLETDTELEGFLGNTEDDALDLPQLNEIARMRMRVKLRAELYRAGIAEETGIADRIPIFTVTHHLRLNQTWGENVRGMKPLLDHLRAIATEHYCKCALNNLRALCTRFGAYSTNAPPAVQAVQLRRGIERMLVGKPHPLLDKYRDMMTRYLQNNSDLFCVDGQNFDPGWKHIYAANTISAACKNYGVAKGTVKVDLNEKLAESWVACARADNGQLASEIAQLFNALSRRKPVPELKLVLPEIELFLEEQKRKLTDFMKQAHKDALDTKQLSGIVRNHMRPCYEKLRTSPVSDRLKGIICSAVLGAFPALKQAADNALHNSPNVKNFTKFLVEMLDPQFEDEEHSFYGFCKRKLQTRSGELNLQVHQRKAVAQLYDELVKVTDFLKPAPSTPTTKRHADPSHQASKRHNAGPK